MDPLNLDGLVKEIHDLLDVEIPRVGNVLSAQITALGTVGATLITEAGTMLHGIIKDVFDRTDKLAERFSLPVRITISKPGDVE